MKSLNPTIKLLCTVQLDGQGNFAIPYRVGKGASDRTIQFTAQVSKYNVEKQNREPIPIPDMPDGYWLFHNRVLIVENTGGITNEELLVHIKHRVLRAESNWKRMQKQIEAFENLERTPSAKREKIMESVRLFVWQRDEGKCVKCGSQEKLEFDHIIPFADGGSNTERNIQLLCEQCNRQKGKNVS
ncbi:MAG: HNH endonuclease [Acidobacteria bacterium]|nr:HNH endonuclease [Acidobacteriota bacterium]